MKDSTTMDDQYGGQLAPDTVLPQQFFGPLRQKAMMDGEHRLMVAVLEDGVRCFQRQMNTRDPKGHQLYLDAEDWITSTDQTWFFSFVNVCQTLDLDPDYIREGLLAWRDAHRADPADAGASEAEEAGEPPLRRASGA